METPPDPIPPAPGATIEPPVKTRRTSAWELAIVVAIFTLLAAITIPNLTKTRPATCNCGCIANLKQIDGAVQQWALENRKAGTAMVTTSDILDFLKGNVLPDCPAKGTYSVSTVSSSPTCSIGVSNPGHSL